MAAAKKKAGTALAARGNTLPANWEEEMKSYVTASSDAAATMGGGQQFLSIRAGVLKFDGKPLKDSQIDCVVMSHVFENAYYEGSYDPDNPSSPVCFAFGSVKAGQDGAQVISMMAPHADSGDKQHDQCKGCPKNEFGTADKGKGKACKNIVKLALLHADDVKKGKIEDGAVIYLKVPPTSLKAWKAHVQSINNVLGKPECGVVTRIKVRPDDKTQVAVEFEMLSEVTSKDILGRLFVRGRKLVTEMTQPYGKFDEAGKKKGPAKKASKGAVKPAAKQAKRKTKF